MLRSKALVILTRSIFHHCPYKGQSVHVGLCYMNAQDGESEFCYGCDHVEKLKERYGLRSFKRQITLSACKHCAETWSLHDQVVDGKRVTCTRVPSCPGFEPMDDEGYLYVPTNMECTEWMTVNVATGERFPYVEHRGRWDGELKARRFHLPLLGAPGTVRSDSRDDLRIELAARAEKRRGYHAKVDDDGELQPVTTKKARKSRKSK